MYFFFSGFLDFDDESVTGGGLLFTMGILIRDDGGVLFDDGGGFLIKEGGGVLVGNGG